MNCQDISLALDDRDIGALSEKERREFDAHISACPDCAEDWQIHQRMVVASTAQMPSALPAQVQGLVAARLGSGRRLRMRNRLVPLGILLAIGAAAAILFMRLMDRPELHVASAVPARGPAPAIAESAGGATPAPTSDSSEIVAQPATEDVLPPEVLPAVKPFSVQLMSLENKAKDPAGRNVVDAMYAAFVKRLRAVPGVNLVEMDLQDAQQTHVEFRLTMTADVTGDKIYGSLKTEIMDASGSPRSMSYSSQNGDIAPHCTTSLPIHADFSACMDPEGMAVNFVGFLRKVELPPDASLRRQLQARLLDRSLDDEQRLQTLNELAGFARGYTGFGAAAAAPVRPLREPVVLRAAIGLATSAADPVRRAGAWNGMRGLGRTELIPPLVTALREDSNGDVRLAALGALTADYADDPRVHAALELAARQEKEPLVQALAQRALGGPDAEAAWRDYMVTSLKDANRSPIERIEALYYQNGRPISKARSVPWSSNQSVVRLLDHDAIVALISVLPAAVADSETLKMSTFGMVSELVSVDDPAITDMLLANVGGGQEWLSPQTIIQAMGAMPSRREDPRVRAALATISASDPDAELRKLAAQALQNTAPNPYATAADKPRLGVNTSFATPQESAAPELAGKLIVRAMALGSVADKAGMREGDAVLEINGTPISSGQILIKTLDAVPRGVDIDVVVSRAGQTLNLKARF